VERRPLRLRNPISFTDDRSIVNDMLASRCWRHVAYARRFRCSDEFGVQVVAAVSGSLFGLDRNVVRVGERILANAGHLPGNLHVRFVRLDDEAMIRNLVRHDRLRELSDHCELITEIAIECLEPFGQLNRCFATCVGLARIIPARCAPLIFINSVLRLALSIGIVVIFLMASSPLNSRKLKNSVDPERSRRVT